MAIVHSEYWKYSVNDDAIDSAFALAWEFAFTLTETVPFKSDRNAAVGDDGTP